MTDITRLLASLKRRSDHAKDFGDDVTFVKLEDLDALVEVLEEAQKRNGELETYSKTALEFREAARDENRHLKLELEIAEKRIAGLEESHAQVIQSRDHYKRMSEEGLKQLAESRTVTVKLPQRYSMLFREGFSEDYRTEIAYSAEDIQEMLTAAGIKWEAE
ncbi:hypothetical protein NOX19_000126 [Klebsiella aerogenes]|nr:hypothetical protein [Klebsiella aerogenes]EKW5854052.1 hypothetical protein [Klebsiella aerogenes]